MEFIKPGQQFDFMSKRWLFIGLSALLLLLSVFSFIKPGFRELASKQRVFSFK
jgi:preprotein translocase subunit SecF